MKKMVMNILGTVISAAIVGNVTFLFKVDARLTRIETILTRHNQFSASDKTDPFKSTIRARN